MNFNCQECGQSVSVHPPKGRWLIDPNLFVAQNPTSVPLGYNIMLTEAGTKVAECRCTIHFEIGWEIVWSNVHKQGGRVRYIMAQPIPFKKCVSCDARWTHVDGGFSPANIDCTNSATRVSNVLARSTGMVSFGRVI